MDPVGSSAGGSASGSAGMGTRSGTKKKVHVESVYARGPSYKKAKKPDDSGVVVNSSAGPLSVDMLHGGVDDWKKSWGNEMDSEESSIGGTSDVENIKNTIVEETSYVDSDTSRDDELMGNAMSKGLRTRTYVFEHPPKQPSFIDVGGAGDVLELLSCTFNESNQLLPVASRDWEIRSFISVKSFALDIELSAIIDGFGGASTPSKFPGIIRSSFTSEKSLIKAKKMAISEKILVNDDLRKVNSRSDREVIIKEIPVDLPKSVIEAVFSKFGKIISIKVQLIGLWQKALVEYESSEITDLVAARWFVLMGKDSVHVAKASDQHWALLYTLPVGTTAHDLSALVEVYGGKTCFIGRNPSSYIRDQYAVICFESEASKLAAIGSVLVFKDVSLHWAGLSLACCTVCKQFGHVSDVCSMGGNSGAHSKRVVTSQNWVRLANVYRRKQASITYPVSFGGKTWAQVASGTSFCVVSSGPFSVGASFGAGSALVESSPSDISGLCSQLAILECSLELLADRVSAIVKKLSCVEVVSSESSFLASHSVAFASLASCVDLNIVLDVPSMASPSLCPTIDNANPDFGSSSLKVLTAKIGGLELKLMALDASVSSVLARLDMLCSGLGSSVATCNVRGMNIPAKQKDIVRWHKNMGNLVSIFTETKLKDRVRPWIANKFNGVWVFFSGLDSGYLGAGVAVVMDSSLARHMCRVSEVPGQLLSVRLLFKNKLSVSILGLYAGASSVVWFSQADEINSFIAKAVNESSFVILGGDFNEDGSHKSASFKRCFDLGLVNFLVGSPAAKTSTWENSRDVTKVIDYVFVSLCLVNAIVHHKILNVNEHFDTDHRAVSVNLGLGGLLDTCLISLHKQVNRNCWKFDIKGANDARWLEFKDASAANASMFSDAFEVAVRFSDVDTMWNIVRKIMVLSAGGTFKKKWFKGFNSVFTRTSSRFYKLELLVSKLVKASHLASSDDFASLLEVWHRLDSPGASEVKSLFLSGSNFDIIHSALAKARKSYCSLKFLESKRAEKSSIKQAIGKRMESFELNKSHTIRSVLECPFRKMVLDHLVVEEELILEPDLVKSKVDKIMKGWTRKREVVSDFSEDWVRQFWPLDYVFDGAFSNVMCSISFNELSTVVKDLLNGKAAGLFGISNELWKHCDKSILDMLLVLLNFCLGVLMNTHPIALIEMAHKILSKILLDRISLACSTFDVLHGNNFLVLKDTTTQSPIFAVGSVVEDVLEKNCQVDPHARLTLFLTAGAFIDDTIWVGSSQTATQHILNIASEFFRFNDISVNNDKTVAIPINCRVLDPRLTISGAPISIARKGEFHHYLDKQYAYLVSAVLFPIISYRTQFSFISLDVCNKWDALVHKIFKSKSGLPRDFPSDALHHPSLYNLKTFKQIQAESKLASIIAFANFTGVLGHGHAVSDIRLSHDFGVVRDALPTVGAARLSVYTDGSLFSLGSVDVRVGAAVFFKNINLGLSVEVSGLVSSTLTELQAIALALECVPFSCSVDLFSDSQAALDACNDRADALAKNATLSAWRLPHLVNERFLCAGGVAVSGNSRHFVRDVFWLCTDINWSKSSIVWHPNSHLASGFTSMCMASCCTYFMKTLHHWLPVAVRKHLYNRRYPSVVCLFCGDVETSDHVFLCPQDAVGHAHLLGTHVSAWKALSGLSCSSSCVLQALASCVFEVGIGVALCKGFVFDEWFRESVSVFNNSDEGTKRIVSFVYGFCLAFRDNIWLVCTRHRAFMEKRSLIPCDGSTFVSVSGLSKVFSADVVKLLGVAEAFGVGFGFCRFCPFFSGIEDLVSYDKSKPFILDYEATVDSSIAVMKKTAEASGSNASFKPVLLRKKRRGEAGDTTGSNSIDMEEKCLVEETSFDFGEGSKVKMTKALGKPLGKINFLACNDDNNILLDAPLDLPPFLKNMVNVLVRKFFVLDIGLDKMFGKSSQEKLVVAVVIKEIPIGTLAEAVRAALFEFGVIKAIKMQLIRLWQKTVMEFEQLDQADLVAAE
ncbi:hypothetical protein G9A89_021805 [Geosiphon pyriformis]|nr:hypothetical protein G9A89_021805 [Geosiphon pyriformis]